MNTKKQGKIGKAFGELRDYTANTFHGIVLEPDQFPLLGRLGFIAIRHIAKLVGVHGIFLTRADAIARKTRKRTTAAKFLKNYINLQLGRNIDGFVFDFPRMLETDEERRLTLELLEGQLVEGTSAELRDAAKLQIFRMLRKEWNDPDVIDFVKGNLEGALAKSISAFHASASIFDNTLSEATLLRLANLFEGEGRRFFLLSSTLLGAIRDGGFDRRLNELALGVFANEISVADIVRIAESIGNDTVVSENGENIRFSVKDGPVVKFHRGFREQDRIRFSDSSGTVDWHFSTFNLIEYEFIGRPFYIPDVYEKILHQNYGNWRTPNIVYNREFDTSNHTYTRSAKALLKLTDLLVEYVNAGSRHHSNESARFLRDYFGIDYTEYFPKAYGELAVPEKYLLRPTAPKICLMDSFGALSPSLIAVIESVIGLGMEAIVVVPGTRQQSAQGRELAKGTRGVHEVHSVDWLKQLEEADDACSLPEAIVTNADIAKQLPASLKQKCNVLYMDRNTIALTRDTKGNLILRARQTVT